MNPSFSFCVLGSVCSDIVINIPVLPAAGRVIEGTLKAKGFGGKVNNLKKINFMNTQKIRSECN